MSIQTLSKLHPRQRNLKLNNQNSNKIPIYRHRPEDFSGMHAAGKVAATILDEVSPIVKPGTSTDEIDLYITDLISKSGAKSATIDYRGYKHASCISVNHVVCHGVPGPKRLQDGDILNIDVTVIVDGWHGDTSRMYVAGTPSRKAERLIKVTHEALMFGISEIKPGATFGDIGATIQGYAEINRMSVVREFCGHGLGRKFHMPPSVLHFGKRGSGEVLCEGMFFTIEPMINLGKPDIKVQSDGWTTVTRDRSLSAQFEHSVGVTHDGCEIFTLSPNDCFYPTNWQIKS